MQILKLSLTLPDAAHPNMQVQLCSDEADCSLVIDLPVRAKPVASRAPDMPPAAEDDYVLGGYAGI
jgi:hypothetical protein